MVANFKGRGLKVRWNIFRGVGYGVPRDVDLDEAADHERRRGGTGFKSVMMVSLGEIGVKEDLMILEASEKYELREVRCTSTSQPSSWRTRQV